MTTITVSTLELKLRCESRAKQTKTYKANKLSEVQNGLTGKNVTYDAIFGTNQQHSE